MIALWCAWSAVAATTPVSHDLRWTLTVGAQPVGWRTTTVKFLPRPEGMMRVITGWTEIDGKVGPVAVRYQQNFTATAGDEPASFKSVMEENGNPREVQAGYSYAGWRVTNADAGRSRTVNVQLGRIHLSTFDLLDPESRVALTRFEPGETVRILYAETGDVWEGTLEHLGASTLKIRDTDVDVLGYAWTGPQGRSEFFYSDDGYLVRYQMKFYGLLLLGTLDAPPPGGIDEFPVAVDWPAVEVVDL